MLNWLRDLFGLTVELTRLTPTAKVPEYASAGAAGVDLFADLNAPLLALHPGIPTLVRTNIAIALPRGYEAQIRSRSGLALKHAVHVLNSPGTIDSDYRGAVGVILMNSGEQPYVIHDGDRIAQMVITKVERVRFMQCDSLDETERGVGGFGSTGFGSIPGA